MNKREAYIKSDTLISALTEERNRQGIKTSHLAIGLQMSISSISNIENFSQKPTLPTLIMIADFLGAEIQIKFKKNKARKSSLIPKNKLLSNLTK